MGFDSWKRTQKSRWLLFPRHRLWPCLAVPLRSMVVNHSVKLSFDFSLLASTWKIVRWKNPSSLDEKLTLNGGFTPKKAYAYKAPLWLIFQTARVGSRRAFISRGNFGAYNSAAQSRYAPFLPQGSTPYLKPMYGKRVQANFTPVLLHYNISFATSQ